MTQHDVLAGATDADLVVAVRSGSRAAMAELHARHSDDALRVARSVSGCADAEDLVAESFLRVVDAIIDGKGPSASFRGYLHTVIRNLHIERSRRAAREQAASDKPWLLDTVTEPEDAHDDAAILDELEARRAARALRSLPESWRTLLWELEVRGRKPAEVAADLEVPASTVSATAYRAREGLRLAYLDDHVSTATDRQCSWTRQRLSRYTRGGLSARASARVRDHLDDCRECTGLYAELARVNTRLGAALWPLVLAGGVAAGGLQATPTSRSTPRARSSATPSRATAIGVGVTAAAAAGVLVVALALAGGSTDSSAAPSPVTDSRTGSPADPATDSVTAPDLPRLPPPPARAPGVSDVSEASAVVPGAPAVASPPVVASPPAVTVPVPPAPDPDPEPEPSGPADLEVGEPTVDLLGPGDVADRWLLTVPVLTAGGTPETEFTIDLTLTLTEAAFFVERRSAGWDCGDIEAGDTNGNPFYFDTVTCTYTYTYEPGQPITPFELVVEAFDRPAGSLSVSSTDNDDPDTSNDTRTF